MGVADDHAVTAPHDPDLHLPGSVRILQLEKTDDGSITRHRETRPDILFREAGRGNRKTLRRRRCPVAHRRRRRGNLSPSPKPRAIRNA